MTLEIVTEVITMNLNKQQQAGSITDEVISYIENKIQQGDLKVGDKLPSEEVLSGKLDVSRVSLREALKELKTVGLVETKHGKGSFITSNPSAEAFKNLIPPLVLSTPQDIGDLLEARRFIEIGTTRLAAENADEEHLEDLRKYVAEMREALKQDDHKTFLQCDLHFHLTIAEGSGNKILYELLTILRDFMAEELKVILEIPGRIESSVKFHEKVLHAIKNGNGRKAGKAMDEHIANAKKDLEESLEE